MSFGIKDTQRTMRLYTGYFAGHSPFGQFFRREESHFEVGLGFDL